MRKEDRKAFGQDKEKSEVVIGEDFIWLGPYVYYIDIYIYI